MKRNLILLAFVLISGFSFGAIADQDVNHRPWGDISYRYHGYKYSPRWGEYKHHATIYFEVQDSRDNAVLVVKHAYDRRGTVVACEIRQGSHYADWFHPGVEYEVELYSAWDCRLPSRHDRPVATRYIMFK